MIYSLRRRLSLSNESHQGNINNSFERLLHTTVLNMWILKDKANNVTVIIIATTTTADIKLLEAHLGWSWSSISFAPNLTWAYAASSVLVNRGNVSVVGAAAQSRSSFLPTRGGMARLSRPRATVCKFTDHMYYGRFEPWIVRLQIQRATVGSSLKSINNHWKW